MCGICGIWNRGETRVPRSALESMLQMLEHRGPDGKGIYANQSETLLFGHRRLTVIDKETGVQPLSNEDRSLWVTFNGEIYNYHELTQALVQKGHRFHTKSDTEVLVHTYEEYGIQGVTTLNGMFAYALWDERKETLFLVRDRLGKKPLYYMITETGCVFASEIKAFLSLPSFKKQLNRFAIELYYLYGYIPAPYTIFEGVHALMPAQYACITKKDHSIHTYWTVPCVRNSALSEKECHNTAEKLLHDAVERRLYSDVPLGAFLSGGLDSSIIVGLMSRLSAAPVKTFSIGFKESSFNELPYARIVAQYFKTDHYEYVIEPDIRPMLERVVWHYDQPFADSSGIALFYLAELTKKNVTVALTGDGGDELFMGYPRYQMMRYHQWIQCIPAGLRRPLLNAMVHAGSMAGFMKHSKSIFHKIARYCQGVDHAGGTMERMYHAWFDYFTEMQCRELMGTISSHGFSHVAHVLDLVKGLPVSSQCAYLDAQTYLPDDLLVKVDRSTMAYGLEARSPFLDHTLVEFMMSVPQSYVLTGGKSKQFMRTTWHGLIPAEILSRKKMGFGVPVGEWLRTDLSGFMKRILLDARTHERGIMRHEVVARMIHEHCTGKVHHGYRLWSMLMLELWARLFLDNEKELP